jgi:hypothetical protein
MATSGTVSTTVFNTRKVIDHAFRRAGIPPQAIAGENLQVALDLLYLDLSALANDGIPLWTITPLLLPMYERVATIQTPVGTERVYDVNLRTAQRLTGDANSSEGIAADAFDGDLETACTQVSAAGYIQTMLNSAATVPIFGILPNASGTWDISMQYSDDGIAWTTLWTESALDVVAGEWYWRDVEGVPEKQYWRLQANGLTVLDVTELVFQNVPSEIPMYQLNRGDYNNLPNKDRTGRPTQYWFNRTRQQPEIVLWPSPELQFTFNQVTGYAQRAIQDVGTMQQELEVPQRWYMAIVLKLAQQLVREIREAEVARTPDIDAQAAFELRKAWGNEGDGSDAFFRVNISPYTR